MIYYIIYLGASILLTWMFVPLFRVFGKHYNIIPELKKSVFPHRKNIPYLGGLPLYIGLVGTILLFFLWKVDNPELSFRLNSDKIVGILVGVSVICFIGVVQDIYQKKFREVWILAQLVGAILLVISGTHTDIKFLNIFPISLGEMAAPIYLGNSILSILWILLVINVIDAFEVYDGFIVFVGLVVSVFLFIIALLGGDYSSAFLALVFGGSLLGILWNQLQPPDILLGKLGTGLIGFMLAVLTLTVNYSHNNSLGFLIPPLLLIVPFIAVASVCVRKWSKKSSQFSLHELYLCVNKKKDEVTSNPLIAAFVFSIPISLGGVILYMTSSLNLALAVLIACGVLSILALWKLNSYELPS